MGVPTLEVSDTPAMRRRKDHKVNKGHVVALGKRKKEKKSKHYHYEAIL
jgi:co-chaperonin GroES (HSP10)